MQQIRQKQIHGQLGESLDDDIKHIANQLQYFDEPVQTKADLPLSDNQNGNMRVVLDENTIYCWNEEDGWVAKADTYTETITMDIQIGIDGQTIINTDIKVGQIDGMVSTGSIQFYVNGMIQKAVRDYNVTIDSNFNCVLEWKSRDFQLEISDTISLSYDTLRLS